MNTARSESYVVDVADILRVVVVILVGLLMICLAGCSDQVSPPSNIQLAEFQKAGPATPSVDTDRLVRAKTRGGPYRVVPGDALELTMPAVMRFVMAEKASRAETVWPYIVRVNRSGTIRLPIVGDVEASGRTLPEIEADIIAAYYPEHIVTLPSVFARVLDYSTARVSITGAVQSPGVYALRNDQMSIISLLMEAGGIVDEGAALIRIVRNDPPGRNSTQATAEPAVERSQRMVRLPRANADDVLSDQPEVPPRFRQAVASTVIGALATQTGERVLFPPAQPVRYGSGISKHQNSASGMETGTGQDAHTHHLSLSVSAGDLQSNNIRLIEAPDVRPTVGRITGSNRLQESEPLVLPIKGLNIPFADVALKDGDSVIVERLQQLLITVIGLVNRPGNFPYPPDVRYNLMQAIAFAGGLDQTAEPRYATVYRSKKDGTSVRVTLPIMDDEQLTNASSTLLKPGDIVAVEHTPRTRMTMFLNRAFRVNVGTYYRLNDAWDD